jgi:hypothetical protein
MNLLGLDPGQTTGMALLNINKEQGILDIEGYGEWNSMYQLAKIVDGGFFEKVDVIAFEKYIIYPHAAMSHIGSSVITAQVIGRIQWIAHRNSIAVFEQMASQAKQRWTNERILKHFPVVVINKDTRHCIDALRHALTCWERNFKD